VRRNIFYGLHAIDDHEIVVVGNPALCSLLETEAHRGRAARRRRNKPFTGPASSILPRAGRWETRASSCIQRTAAFHGSIRCRGVTTSLYVVAAPSKNALTAVGEQGVVLQSADGGATWIRQDARRITIFFGCDFPIPDHG